MPRIRIKTGTSAENGSAPDTYINRKTQRNTSYKAFRPSIELSFINIIPKNSSNVQEITMIESNRIVYVMFDYQYYENEMPIIVMYLQVPVSLYKKMIDRQTKAKIKMKITGKNPLAKNSLPEVRMEHTFNYITVNQNQPYGIDTADATEDDKYRGIYIGLVDEDMTKYLRTAFNGIYQNVSLQSLLALALSGSKSEYIIEPFKYDYKYKQIIVPACSTRAKMLEFLYDYDQFYDDYFMFFIDIDKVYLLSQSGNGETGSATSQKNMIIDVRPVSDAASFSEGYILQNQSIYLYMNQMDVSVNTNTSMDQKINKVVSYGERRDSKNLDVSDGDRLIFDRSGGSGDPSNELPNQIKTSTTVIELAKTNINDAIFEPGRVITLKMYDDYEQYSGKYRLLYKRVIYKIDDDEFIATVNVGLIPAGDSITAKSNRTNKNKSAAVSQTARISSSSDEQPTVTSRSDYIQQTTQEEELNSR